MANLHATTERTNLQTKRCSNDEAAALRKNHVVRPPARSVDAVFDAQAVAVNLASPCSEIVSSRNRNLLVTPRKFARHVRKEVRAINVSHAPSITEELVLSRLRRIGVGERFFVEVFGHWVAQRKVFTTPLLSEAKSDRNCEQFTKKKSRCQRGGVRGVANQNATTERTNLQTERCSKDEAAALRKNHVIRRMQRSPVLHHVTPDESPLEVCRACSGHHQVFRSPRNSRLGRFQPVPRHQLPKEHHASLHES